MVASGAPYSRWYACWTASVSRPRADRSPGTACRVKTCLAVRRCATPARIPGSSGTRSVHCGEKRSRSWIAGRTWTSRPCASASRNARSRSLAAPSLSTIGTACRDRARSCPVRPSMAKNRVVARRADGRPTTSSREKSADSPEVTRAPSLSRGIGFAIGARASVGCAPKLCGPPPQRAEVVAVGDLGDPACLALLVDLDGQLTDLAPEGLLAFPHLCRHPDERPGQGAERVGALDYGGEALGLEGIRLEGLSGLCDPADLVQVLELEIAEPLGR